MPRIAKLVALFAVLCDGNVQSQSWQFLGLSDEAIGAIAVDWSNPQTVYVGSVWHRFGANITPGGMFKTTNGGATWDTLFRGTAVLDLDISKANPKTVYATLGIDGVKRSTDGGATWVEADSGVIINSFDGPMPRVLAIDPVHPDTLYLGTSGSFGGYFYKSADQGRHWTSLGDTTRVRNGVSNILVNPRNTQELYVGSASGAGVLRSTDGGVNWSYRGLGGPLINSIEWGSDYSTLYAGLFWQDGGLLVSIDSGLTWQDRNAGLPDSGNVGCVQTMPTQSGDEVWIFDDSRLGDEVLHCDQSWNWKISGTLEKPEEMSITLAVAGKQIYAGGYGIYVTKLVTSVGEQRAQLTEPALSQNYPNPFNPTTTIRYALPSGAHVTMTVFNILGQQVATLVNGSREAGNHEVKFDGSGLASGVYFYRLIAGEYLATKRLVLVR